MLRTLGKLPIRVIDSSMVLTQLRKIEARGSIETAKRVRGYVRAILKRAKGEGLISGDVIADIDDLVYALRPAPPPARLPALVTETQLIVFQQTIDQSSAHILTKLASRFLALTVVRVSTLRLANWTEFQGINWTNAAASSDGAVWNRPAAHMKLEVGEKHNAELNHDIQLSRQAVETLRAIHQITGQFKLVFPRETDWNKPMTDAALARLYQRVAGGRYKDRMVPHGWRAAFSTIMNERAGLLDRPEDRLVIDMILAHIPKGTSSSEWAYNRARYRKPKAALYQVWADIITKDIEPAKTLLRLHKGEGRGYGGRASARQLDGPPEYIPPMRCD